MHSLYIDSTSGLVIGLLDSAYRWIEYKDFEAKKPSEVIHQEIQSLMNRYDLDFKEINFIFSAGPGSYTGMRLGEGIAQILAWDAHRVFSFRHFDVPELMGTPQGFWVTNAFKGQIFLYQWNKEKGISEKELTDIQNFRVMDQSLGYTLSIKELNFSHLKTTKELIHQHPQEIFSNVCRLKLREPPYYFRTLDEEFKC